MIHIANLVKKYGEVSAVNDISLDVQAGEIIDHGRIVAQGTAAELKQHTGTDSLEQAFLKLTGTSIRSEMATGADAMRAMAAMWQRGRR